MCNAVAIVQTPGVVFTPADKHLSFLPLAHMFERIVFAVILMVGGSAGFFQGEL